MEIPAHIISPSMVNTFCFGNSPNSQENPSGVSKLARAARARRRSGRRLLP